MSFELFYAVIGAPLLMLLGGLATVGITKLLERRERRLYRKDGRPRSPEPKPSGFPR
jgi:hypothetical protein